MCVYIYICICMYIYIYIYDSTHAVDDAGRDHYRRLPGASDGLGGGHIYIYIHTYTLRV